MQLPCFVAIPVCMSPVSNDVCAWTTELHKYKGGGGFCVGNSSESVQCLYNWLMIVLLSSEGLEELLSLSFLVPLQYNI